jgi:2-dehydropantoate 2-reductase
MSDIVRRVLVVGAGAIGLVYAGRLSVVPGVMVTLISRRAAVVADLRSEFLIRDPDGNESHVTGLDVRLPENVPPESDGVYDVAIIAVSAYDTAAIAPFVSRLLKQTGVAITIQNGLDNYAALANVLGESRTAQGATSFAVQLVNPTLAQMDSHGATWLPKLPPAAAWVEVALVSARLNPIKIDDPDELVWRKLAIGTNAYLALILASPVSQVVKQPSSRLLSQLASQEVIDIAKASGVMLNGPEILASARAAWGNFKGNARSSFYSDLMLGKMPELEERLGALVRRASSLKVPAPTLQTFYLLSKARLELQGISK